MMQAKSAKGSPFESVLNVRLSDLLRKKGLASSTPEKAVGRKRHDISIKVGMLNAVIEAEKGTDTATRNRAKEEADSRLTGKTADIALALCYPDGTNGENLEEQTFLWAIRSPRTLQRNPEWVDGDLDDLVTVILSLPNELGDPDHLAKRLSNTLDSAVSLLDDATKTMLAEKMDLPMTGKDGLNNAAMRSLLVIGTAIMFHARLGKHLTKDAKPSKDYRYEPPTKYKGEWPPMGAGECAKSESPISAYSRAWGAILAVDYRPVFETALKAFSNPSPELSRATCKVAETVLEITAQAASLRHDLVGRIFHHILDSARYDGSFYTSTAAAAMLASLALREEEFKWGSPGGIKKLRVVDPSCGTGTLLMAAAERMRDLVNRAGGSNGLEKAFIENILHGYDTNLTAIHLAATTLGLLSPGTEFAKMNIERTFLGVDEDSGQASLGSLEFMPDGQPTLLGWAGGQQHVDDTKRRLSEVGKFDLVIMNPPFTRNTLRHAQFSRAETLALRKREQKIFQRYLKANGGGATLHMSSQGNNFVVLADRLAAAQGTVAAILPMVTATNPSSIGIRRFIADKFNVEMIVVPHDPLRQSFSENTAISELLLVCRRRKKGAKCAPARVVALTKNPETPAQAMVAANAIAGNESKDYIVEHKINGEKVIAGDWSAVQFLSPRLSALFDKLRDGGLFAVKPLAEFGDVLSGAEIRVTMDRREHAPREGMIALWNHKTNIITGMAASHDTYVEAKPNKKEKAQKLWAKRGRLMLPARLWLPLTRAPAVIVSRPAVASAWYPFNFSAEMETAEKEKREKAICLYINSSAGVLGMMGVRDFKKLGYPNFSIYSIGELPVPDFGDISDKQINAMAKAFDNHSGKELKSLRSMSQCPVRKKIDNAVADALGISHNDMDELRELLPAEPSISNKRYQKIPLHSAVTQGKRR